MTKTTDLATLADTLGGTFKPFSQSLDGIRSARTGGGYSSDKMNLPGNVTDLYVGGTCETMSLYWIIGDHAGLGVKRSGFIDWVLPAGMKGAPNMGAVSVLVAKTAMYKASGPRAAALGITKDMNFSNDFLSQRGIRADIEGADGIDGVKAAISQPRSRYFIVSYFSDTGGHGCAASSSERGDFAYFDPNYGEARLPVAACMRAWYEGYLKISGYDGKYPTIYSDAYRT